MSPRAAAAGARPALTFHPLTPERWPDLTRLFGASGAYSGCWCMFWRTSRAQFARNGNDGNRRAFQRVVRAGPPPGILAYDGGEPVGWCSVAPRETYPSLERSTTLKRVDDRPVWSIVCFFIARSHRNRGMMRALIRGALDYVRARGGRIVEAYPVVERGQRIPAVSSYMGLAEAFRREGFVEVAQPSRGQLIVRRALRPRRAGGGRRRAGS